MESWYEEPYDETRMEGVVGDHIWKLCMTVTKVEFFKQHFFVVVSFSLTQKPPFLSHVMSYFFIFHWAHVLVTFSP